MGAKTKPEFKIEKVVGDLPTRRNVQPELGLILKMVRAGQGAWFAVASYPNQKRANGQAQFWKKKPESAGFEWATRLQDDGTAKVYCRLIKG